MLMRRLALRADGHSALSSCSGRCGATSQCLPRRSAACHARRSSSSSGSSGSGGGAAGAAALAPPADDFCAALSEEWGARWSALAAALAAPTRHVALQNAFLPHGAARPEDVLPGAQPLAAKQPHLAALLQPPVQALAWEPPAGAAAAAGGAVSYPPPPADPASGLTTHYWLDAASLLPPLLLDVRPGQAVLDMCAAPGGKSLVLAQLLLGPVHAAAEAAAAAGGGGAASSPLAAGSQGSDSDDDAFSGGGEAGSGAYSGSLVANEIDAGRRARLVRVLRSYVPPPARYRIRVTPHDGARWWGRQEAESYDRVLLDAPCSSDRHVAQQAAARGGHVTRADWSLQRCRRIAGDQAKLLTAGLRALRPGGRLVYSTCSILGLENDGVVARVLELAGGSVQVISHSLQAPPGSHSDAGSGGGGATTTASSSSSLGGQAAVAALERAGAERTRHGWLLLPDAPGLGCGPIYLAVLHKGSSSPLRRVKVNKYARQGG